MTVVCARTKSIATPIFGRLGDMFGKQQSPTTPTGAPRPPAKHTTTFGFWLQAKAQGEHEVAALFERRFRLTA